MDVIPVAAGIFAFGVPLSWSHIFAEPE